MASLVDKDLVHDHHVAIAPHVVDIPMNSVNETEANEVDYSERGQWVRAAILGANDGLVSVASLMMGIGAVREDDMRAMLLAGFAGLIAGACSMAIGEFVSVYTQRDIEVAQRKRVNQKRTSHQSEAVESDEEETEKLPNPFQAAIASALAFSVGAMMPLLAAALVRSGNHVLRLGVIGVVASFALVVFGGGGAVLGKTPVAKSVVRVLVGGWLAMAVTYGMTKLIGSGAGLQM